jgi:hypothetical protein
MKTGLISGGIALIATLGISAMALAGPAQDFDGDGMFDVLDNCSTVAQDTSFGQECDTDQDGYGNFCDGDFDNDGFTIPFDFDIFNTDFTSTGVDSGVGTDMDCDTYVIPFDFDLFNGQFTSTGVPGPSGLSCAGTVPCTL